MKAYEVRNVQTGEVVWATNNLPAAYRKADRNVLWRVYFNYCVNGAYTKNYAEGWR